MGRSFRSALLMVGVICMVAATTAHASPGMRYQVNQRGNFILFGNTVGYDCAGGVPAPVVGTIGQCGSDTSDTAPDIFFRSEDPNDGHALADTSINDANARTTAILSIPAGAQITYARLYWGAEVGTPIIGNVVTLDRPGGFSQSVTADANWTAVYSSEYFYQASVDVTSLLKTNGPGTYRVSNIASVELANRNDTSDFIAWGMVVFYSLPTDPPRNLTLFDGFDVVTNGSNMTSPLSGFVVPNAGYDAQMGVLAYEGDNTITGDSLYFNGTALSNAINPSNNFFNGTRSQNGNGVSNVGDLPQLSGLPGSMSGVDLDVVNITAQMHPGDTNATIKATSTGDTYFLGMLVTSISTLQPEFSNLTKTVTNLSETGANRPGDVLQYTLTLSNTGSDTATGVLLTDPLPANVTYDANSIVIVSGANAGRQTDGAGDDEAEYDSTHRQIVVRLGAGANATQGGSIAVGDAPQEVTFWVTINANATGTIANQAFVSAQGQQAASEGVSPTTFASSDGNQISEPTVATVDLCANDNDCSAAAPHCDTTQSPHACTVCVSDSDCPAGSTCAGGGAACTLTPPTIAGPNGLVLAAPITAGSNTVTVSGSAAPGATVTVSEDGNTLGTVVANANGTWSLQEPAPADGNHTVSASQSVSNTVQTISSSSSSDTFAVVACLQNADCGGGSWCNRDVCAAQGASGTPVQGTTCGTGTTAACSSGTCDVTTNLCGSPDGASCQSASQCSSNQCDNDGLCGLSNGTSCQNANECRSSICSNGSCGAANGQACTANSQCRDSVCAPDGICGVPNGNPCNANDVCRSSICFADGSCGETTGSSCQSAADCRSAVCSGGVCGPTCSSNNDCQSNATCINSACVVTVPAQAPSLGTNGSSCQNANQCASGICATDGLCGSPNNAGCQSGVQCRSGVCSSKSNTCVAACSSDSDCGAGTYCDGTSSTCTTVLANGSSCTRAAQCSAFLCNSVGTCGQVNGQPCGSSQACVASVCNANDTNCGTPNGQSCSETQPSTCRSSACDTGTCSACTASTDCGAGSTCDTLTGTCSTPSAAGPSTSPSSSVANIRSGPDYGMEGGGLGCAAAGRGSMGWLVALTAISLWRSRRQR